MSPYFVQALLKQALLAASSCSLPHTNGVGGGQAAV